MISVIIPAYNSEKFIEKSVLSAVHLKEVGEVIIIDDGSTDQTFQICQKLCLDHQNLRLLQHPNKENLGESSSRNFGILNSKFEYISFLDSDDYYLPHRFEKDLDILNSSPEASAVYSKTAIKFINSDRLIGFGGDVHERLVRPINENNLKVVFEEKLTLFDVNGVTLRKSFLLENKLFDSRLRLHPDTELWWRLLKRGVFYPGNIINPVAVAVRHGNNVIQEKSLSSELKLLVVYIDNVGLNNLKDFEKKYFNYLIGRALSNPVRNHFLRKFVFHSFKLIANLSRLIFIPLFYRWGMKKFKLAKN